MQLVEDLEHPTDIVNINDKMSVDAMEVEIQNIPNLISKINDNLCPANEQITNDIIDNNDDKSEEKIISMDVDINLKNNHLDEVNNIELTKIVNCVTKNLGKELEETTHGNIKCIEDLNNIKMKNSFKNDNKHLDKGNDKDINDDVDNEILDRSTSINEKVLNNVNKIYAKNAVNDDCENERNGTTTVNNDNANLNKIKNIEVKEIVDNDHLEKNHNMELKNTVNNDEHLNEEENKRLDEQLLDTEKNKQLENSFDHDITQLKENKNIELFKSVEDDEVQLNIMNNTEVSKTLNDNAIKDVEIANDQNNGQHTSSNLKLENAIANSIDDNITPLLLNGVLENNELGTGIINSNINTDESETILSDIPKETISSDIQDENISSDIPEETILSDIPEDPCIVNETEITDNSIDTLIVTDQVTTKTQSPTPDSMSKTSLEVTTTETNSLEHSSKETKTKIIDNLPATLVTVHENHKSQSPIPESISETTEEGTKIETIAKGILEDSCEETKLKTIEKYPATLDIMSVQDNNKSFSLSTNIIPDISEEVTKSKIITSEIPENPTKETETKIIDNLPKKTDNMNTQENNKSQSPIPDNVSDASEIATKKSIDVLSKSTEMEVDVEVSQQQDNTENNKKSENNDEVEIMEIEEIETNQKTTEENNLIKPNENTISKSCLVNTLDIISDDEDEIMKDENKTCIDLDEDDDIMLIEDECNEILDNNQKSMAIIEGSDNNTANKDQQTTSAEECISLDEEDVIPVIQKENSVKEIKEIVNAEDEETKKLIEVAEKVEKETVGNKDDVLVSIKSDNKHEVFDSILANDATESPEIKSKEEICNKSESEVTTESCLSVPDKESLKEETTTEPTVVSKPLVPPKFITSFKSKITEMSRDELEEFCLLKIVEGITDRINLGEIKTKLKTMTQHVEEWRKKATTLMKQTRDLQIVLEKVQGEYKKSKSALVTPMRITRSVGMQVFMSVTKSQARNRKLPPTPNKATRPAVPHKGKPNQNNTVGPQMIPVPKLVPVNTSSPVKTIRSPTPQVYAPKNTLNGVKNASPANKADKRPFTSTQSVTVDLTDDEPPAKLPAVARNPNQNVRLVPPQQLMTRPQFLPQTGNSPRKVFIPISGQSQNIRAGQTIMFKTMQPMQRTRAPNPNMRMPSPNNARNPRLTRHPAPLPDAAKQSQPPNWKALPPSPDLKISKVDNGIVISWKIEGYQEDSYEEIASYQLYAYQETSSPPSTTLWKKIGDVKALPLPMACTLTQFMAGYKYYFAVRAVDVRSRIGPFSLPGSILLLNK